MKTNVISKFLFTISLQVLIIIPVTAQDESHSNRLPHSVNAPMGIPDPVGSFNVRLNAFQEQNTDGTFEDDVSGHISYGLSKIGGLHLRSLGIRTTPFTEFIGMVNLWQDLPMKQGISLVGILGVPTGKKDAGEHHGLSYLAGLAGRITLGPSINNDVVLHYDFTAKHYIAESGTVIRLSPNIFGSIDTRTTIGGSLPEVLLMPSLKFALFSLGFIGVGYNIPARSNSSFHHQALIQVEIGNH